jgi:transcription antitermination factor NusG
MEPPIIVSSGLINVSRSREWPSFRQERGASSVQKRGKSMNAKMPYPPVTANSVAIEKNWFAVFTVPRHEKRIETYFQIRGIENFLPIYQKQSQWKGGSKKTLQLPLFSNYIFVRISQGERVPVLKVPGVIVVLGGGPNPMPIPDSYIDSLREGLRGGKIEPHPCLTVGTRVRIRSGVMAGMQGILLRKKNNLRVVVTLEMIMKSVTVEVHEENIEMVPPECESTAPAFARSA